MKPVSVDPYPASAWDDPRLDALAPELWAATRPSTDEVAAERLAAEVFALAVDSANQGGFHIDDDQVSVRVQDMVRSRRWLIWWD